MVPAMESMLASNKFTLCKEYLLLKDIT